MQPFTELECGYAYQIILKKPCSTVPESVSIPHFTTSMFNEISDARIAINCIVDPTPTPIQRLEFYWEEPDPLGVLDGFPSNRYLKVRNNMTFEGVVLYSSDPNPIWKGKPPLMHFLVVIFKITLVTENGKKG